MATVEKDKLLPAYVPFGTNKNYLLSFKEHGPPSRIDRSTMVGMAGGTQSHLTASLKFLKLVGPAGEPTKALEDLVEAIRGDRWAEGLAVVIEKAYAPVIGDLDIKRATAGQLTEAFRKQGFDGATLDKSLRFYLQALKEANIPHSPQIAALKPRNQIRKALKSKPAVAGTPAGGTNSDPPAPPAPPASTEDSTPKGMLRIPIYIRNKTTGYILVPDDITADECRMIDIAATAVKQYAGAPAS